ncbi:sporulation inhibitor of replication protein SirA [Alkalicoccobacillus porphyridii]|uniref:Sporulation inhibitor of replication protein SirA n=1 Tax=Alkalicoccobacillus porphyridii TaxID=2597270 RepID=A0A553ZUJ5_9BACI|nr:sporulation inhibitor of replication protein SirA [Alkalicoccobacillus porphyridii]TSB45170.1 sporulation inhibitor of replication protein SirA [Alkalicoccobacillus porphyridii]
MRSYQLYLLEEDIVQRYYGQEIKLFNLFCERFQANLALKPLLTKQVEFITKPLPVKHLTKILSKEDHYLNSDQINISTFRMAHPPSESWIDVKLRDHYLLVTAFGKMEVETRLFERLKELDSHFFAVNVGQHRFGWLGPLKKAQAF